MKCLHVLLVIPLVAGGSHAKPDDPAAALLRSVRYTVRVRTVTVLENEELASSYGAFVLPSDLVPGHTRKRVWYLVTAGSNVADGEEFKSIGVYAQKSYVRRTRGSVTSKWSGKSKRYRGQFVGVDRTNNVLLLRIHPKEGSFRIPKRYFPKIVSAQEFAQAPLAVGSTVYTVGTLGDNPIAMSFVVTRGKVLLPAEPENHRLAGEKLWKERRFRPDAPVFQWPRPDGANYWSVTEGAYRVYHSCKTDRSSIGSPLLRLRMGKRGYEPEVVGVNVSWKRTGGRTTSKQVYAIPMKDLLDSVVKTLFQSQDHRRLLSKKKRKELGLRSRPPGGTRG